MKTINWTNALTGGSAAVLVGSQTIAIGFAGAWAMSGLLGLPSAISIAFEALVMAAAAYATYEFARRIHAIEPFWGPPPAQKDERVDAAGPSAPSAA